MRIVALVFAFSVLAHAAPDAGPATISPLKFAWPAPARVGVVEKVLKKGRTSTMAYDAVLTARKGGGYALKLEKIRFVHMNGQPVDRANLSEEVRQAELFAAVVPTLLLTADGMVEGVTGWDEMMESVLKASSADPATREKVRAVFTQPGMQEAMKQKAGDFWNAWVGSWIGFDLAPGASDSGAIAMPVPPTTVDAVVTLRNHGPDASAPGSVRLEMQTAFEGEPFRRAMVAMMKQMMGAAVTGSQHKLDVDKTVKEARRITTVEVVTDRATLNPRRARMTSVVTMTSVDPADAKAVPQTKEEREEREYEFAWAK